MRISRFVISTAFAVVGIAAAAGAASAQELSGKGFLFGAPTGSVSFRLGYAGANAGSDLFSQVTHDLSLNRGDFASMGWGLDLAFALRPRLDLVVSGDFSGMTKKSDFREWQDNSGKPIEQTTSFSRQSATMALKYYLLPYGRTLGKFAWVPARYAPWLSAGVGRTLYRFKQEGDFIDFKQNNKVFHDTFQSSEWGNTAQFSAGLDWNLNQRFALTTQAKYLWGKADLGIDFSGFQPIDLSGIGMTGGLTIRF
jgi:opacity protein-like surface antigen